jgi:hypothetical protein
MIPRQNHSAVHLKARFVILSSFVLAAIAFTGCAVNSSESPPPTLDRLYDTYSTEVFSNLKNRIPSSGTIEATSTTDRNLIINDLILLIDQHYYQIERNLYAHKSWADFTGSVVSAGLGTAGAIAGGNTAQIMSALIAALESTKTAVNKDLLQGQTITAIIAKMRANRATKLLAIRQSMTNDLSAYPLSQALIDVMEYYNDGTFVGAIQSITEQAAADTQNAKAALNKKKHIKSANQILGTE